MFENILGTPCYECGGLCDKDYTQNAFEVEREIVSRGRVGKAPSSILTLPLVA
jgi:hypothetical protein